MKIKTSRSQTQDFYAGTRLKRVRARSIRLTMIPFLGMLLGRNKKHKHCVISDQQT